MALALTSGLGATRGSPATPGGQPSSEAVSPLPSLPLAGDWGPRELF